MRYSVIMPACNEADRIEATLAAYAPAFADSEIIVVANACQDDTCERVMRFARLYPGVRCIRIDRRVGKGGAVRAGFLVAKAPLVGFADADGSTPASELRRLFESVGEEDGVVASRWLPGARIERRQPLVRHIASRVFNAFVRALFLLPFSDTQCGAKIFRKGALQRVVTHVETSNMAFDVELLLALRDAGATIREEATHWVDVRSPSFTLVTTSLRMFAALLRMRLRRSFFRSVIPIFDYWIPTKPMRAHEGFNILLLNWRDPTHPQAGGAERYLLEIGKRWIAGGHRVSWLTASYPGAPKRDVVDGMHVTRVGNARTVYAALPLEYVRNFRDRFDVVIDAENGIPFFSPLFSMKPKICLMHHVHQQVFRRHLPFPLSSLLAWAERRLVPFFYQNVQFVAVSNDTREEMQRLRFSTRPVEVIHNGVDPQLVPGEKSPVPTLLCLGRLKPYKRIDLVVRAFAAVRATVPGAVLRIAGTGDAAVLAQLAALAAELGVRDAVSFEGFVDGERKRRLLQEAWACVSASEIEGWGVTVIEANACGTPAIAYAVPGLREAVASGVSGLLVPEGGDLAGALQSVLTDATLRAHLERGAVEHAQRFSWDVAAGAMLDVVAREVIGQDYGFIWTGDRWVLHGADLARVDLSASTSS